MSKSNQNSASDQANKIIPSDTNSEKSYEELRKKLDNIDNPEDDISEHIISFEWEVDNMSDQKHYFDFFNNELKKYSDGLFSYKFNLIAFPQGIALEVKTVNVGEETLNKLPDAVSMEDVLKELDISSDIKNEFETLLSKSQKPPEETNMFIYGRGLLILKGLEKEFWSEAQAKEDVKFIRQLKRNHLAKLSGVTIDKNKRGCR